MQGIITLCGSTRFYRLFDYVNYWLTLNDWIVLSIGCHSHADIDYEIKSDIDIRKPSLDDLHKEKIQISRAIFVIDKNGYIGDSTKGEIACARKLNLPIYQYTKNDLKSLCHFVEPVEWNLPIEQKTTIS